MSPHGTCQINGASSRVHKMDTRRPDRVGSPPFAPSGRPFRVGGSVDHPRRAFLYLLIGIITCAPGVPASISQGRPCPLSAASRWLTADTPMDSGVALGTDITHSNLIRPSSLVAR